ncbi:MAG: RNA polymerase factor sigma-54 [Bacteroidales bacterium]|jgi:RNA polymerase sigma-54 factor|nr:RNA polymerase factor sigma-54 [Bacteroidales bacterium]
MNTQHLSLEQKMGLKMSPRQVQLMRLLQVPGAELQDTIREEIENNPALEDCTENDTDLPAETDDLPETSETSETETGEQTQDILDDYFNEDEFDSYRERSIEKEDRYQRPAVERAGFQQQTLQQFRLLPASKLQQTIGEIIIGNLDDNGYLARSIEAMTNDLAFSQNISVTPVQVEEVLKMVQTLDPAGIGARSLRECLQIQLDRGEVVIGNIPNAGNNHTDNDVTNNNAYNIAKKIVATDTRFDEFTSRKYDLLIKRFKISEQEFKDAVAVITSLNPRPGGGGEATASNYSVTPDFIITVFENEIAVSLNRDYEPSLRVNPAYSQMLTEYSSDKTAAAFIKQKIENARSFIDLIKQRQTTLLKVIQTIIDLQRNYFLTGERSLLKPMILKDIAEKTKLDISTISRITANKYAQTPYGIILLKDLFSQALQNEDGNDVSSIEVKAALKKIIDNEDHLKPFTDDALANEMKKTGFPISRRTVTKYREMLNIPVARMRRGV